MRSLMLLVPILLFSAQIPPQAQYPQAQYPQAQYKESGSANAPVVFEAYTDYECPYCAVFFREIVPPLMEQYVKTGRMKFVHRDFPLPMHPHARQAARYANAAGEMGRYELVANQIFQTQNAWSKTGNIDAEVARVLPPGDIQKLRAIVQSHGDRLEATVKRDVDMGTNVDHVAGTPTVVIVDAKGKREVVQNAAFLPLSVWKSYLDAKLSR